MSMSDPYCRYVDAGTECLAAPAPGCLDSHSKLNEAVARVLKEEGYIEDYQVLPEKPRPVLRIKLKYVGDRRNRESVITDLQRVSKPGGVYVGSDEIPWVLNGMGIAVLTTPQGVMTGHKPVASV